MNITIRKAKPEDADGWVKIRKDAWLATYLNEEHGITMEDLLSKDYDSPEKVKMWRDSFTIPTENRFYLTAFRKGEIVGFLIGQEHEEINEICAIYVSPTFHRQGIGSRLMAEAMKQLNPGKKTKLNVVSYNKKAINFYKKHGYIENGPFDDKHGHLPNGKILPEIEMIKE